MKIWLDDLRPIPPQYDHWCVLAREAIACLATGEVTDISLDHDLGPPEAGTGYDVAVWIEEQAFNGTLPKLNWRIHSANAVGRKNMEAALQNADRFWNRAA